MIGFGENSGGRAIKKPQKQTRETTLDNRLDMEYAGKRGVKDDF